MSREILGHQDLEPYLNGKGDLLTLNESLRADYFAASNALKSARNPEPMILVVMISAADLYRRAGYLSLEDERCQLLLDWAGRLEEIAAQSAVSCLGLKF